MFKKLKKRKDLRNKLYKDRQKELLSKVSDLIIGSDASYEIENCGGDIHYLINKGRESQFTVEINLGYTEFYKLPKYHNIIDSSIDNYCDAVTIMLTEFLSLSDKINSIS